MEKELPDQCFSFGAVPAGHGQETSMPCVICGSKSKLILLFEPHDPEEFAGKRIIPLGLCRDCDTKLEKNELHEKLLEEVIKKRRKARVSKT
jgi:hypothetical protein